MDDLDQKKNEVAGKKEKTDEKNKGKNKERKKENDKSIGTMFKAVKGEFRKIIWPSREDLIKQTGTVIVTSLLFGVILVAMDFIASNGLIIFTDLVGR